MLKKVALILGALVLLVVAAVAGFLQYIAYETGHDEQVVEEIVSPAWTASVTRSIERTPPKQVSSTSVSVFHTGDSRKTATTLISGLDNCPMHLQWLDERTLSVTCAKSCPIYLHTQAPAGLTVRYDIADETKAGGRYDGHD